MKGLREVPQDFSTPVRPASQSSGSIASISPILGNSKPDLLKKTTVLEMAIEAIMAIGVPRKGASYQAIKKWIIANKEVDANSLKKSLKLAVMKGIKEERLVRPRHCASAVGAIGSFMLPNKANKVKSAKINPKPVVEKKAVAKMRPKAKVEPKVASKAKTKKAGVPSKSKVEKKPTIKVAPKAESKKAGVPSKSKVEKKPTIKVASKAESKKAGVPSKAGEKPKAPLIAGARKKPEAKILSTGTELDKNVVSSLEKKLIFSESDEDAPTNNVPTTLKKLEDQPAIKANGKKVTKATKNLKSPDKTLIHQASAVRMDRNKKLQNPNVLDRQELSDTEVAVQKNRLNALKSCSSDTELEVSKREEKRTRKGLKKLPIRAKKVVSKG